MFFMMADDDATTKTLSSDDSNSLYVDDLNCIQSKIAPTKDVNGNNHSLDPNVLSGLQSDPTGLVLDTTNRPKAKPPELGTVDTGFEPDTTGLEPTPLQLEFGVAGFEPDTTKPEATPIELGSGDTGFEPDTTGFEPPPLELEFGDAGLEPDTTNPEATPIELESVDTGFEPDTTGLEPTPLELEFGDAGFEPDTTKPEATPIELESVYTGFEPDTTDLGPSPSEIEWNDLGIEPIITGPEAAPFNLEFDNTGLDPDTAAVGISTTEAKPSESEFDDTYIEQDTTELEVIPSELESEGTDSDPDITGAEVKSTKQENITLYANPAEDEEQLIESLENSYEETEDPNPQCESNVSGCEISELDVDYSANDSDLDGDCVSVTSNPDIPNRIPDASVSLLSTSETEDSVLDYFKECLRETDPLVETGVETKPLATDSAVDNHSLRLYPEICVEKDSPIFRYLSPEPDRYCYSDSEIEMGRRSLSFKSRTPRMIYTKEEFKEEYTTIEKGNSLDSAAKQDAKRGFQRIKAEKTRGQPLRHTRSLSTPAAESYDGRAPIRGRAKGPRAISMVEQGTDTSEYFKDHEDDEANIRLRGIVSPNETNNNKNLEPAPLKIEIKPEMVIKPRKAEDVNSQRPQSNQSPSRGPLTNEDLTIMSGYSSDKKVGITKPIMGDISPTKQNKVSLTKHLQDNDKVDGKVNGDFGVNGVWYRYDVKKTEIALERHIMLKKAMKGDADDKLSPRANSTAIPDSVKPLNGSPVDKVDEEVSRTFRTDENSSPKLIAPKTLVYPAGPFTITTRIVDGEEEMIIGNVELPPITRPQSVPVMSSRQQYRHFACIEPVGQPVGHAPRMSHIEPVLVSQTKRPTSQLNKTITVTPIIPNPEPTEIATDSSNRANSGANSPDSNGQSMEADDVIPMMSVTVMASTMPELQKPEVTRVEDSPVKESPKTLDAADTNDNVIIIPQKEVVVETKKELPNADSTDATDSGVKTKSTSPISDSVESLPSNGNRRNRFVFPSVSNGDVKLRRDAEDSEDDGGVYDASFRNSGWIYIGGNQELQMITGPSQQQRPPAWKQQSSANTKVIKAEVEAKRLSKKDKKSKKKDDKKTTISNDDEEDEAFTREDPARESVTTTASEEEFKQQYRGVALRRIQRKQSIMDYQRLSMIAREREIIVEKVNGLFGFRIQYSKPVVVTDVDKGGAAEAAGLKVGDMMLNINGKDVTQALHSQVVKLAASGPDTLLLLVGTNVCNTLNMEAIKPVLTGYLWKLGGSGVIRSWKKRWFVLKHDNVLYYYKTNEDAEPLGAIVLNNYTIGKSRDVGKPNAFKITKHKARTYHMYASTAEEMNSWAKSITEAARPNSKADIWLDISAHNVSIPALSIKYPDCHGVLTKMGGKRKNWKRRYCVLKDACLYYYKDIDAPQALGVAHFHGYSIQETEIGSKKYAFIMKPPSEDLRTFYFIADHETDRKRWVAAFAYSIGRWIQTNTGEDSDEEEGNEMLI